MARSFVLVSIFTTILTLSAAAQDVKPTLPPAVTTIPSTPPAQIGTLVLTDSEGQSWLDKPVYSNDGQRVGEVAGFQRDAGNKVLGMHAKVGGYFGWLQKRVSISPAHFKLQTDRVVLDMNAEQAKQLPKVQS